MKEITLQIFDELITALNLGPLTTNEKGHYTLIFDDEMFVGIQLKKSEHRIVFTTMLGLLSEAQGNQQLRGVMALSLALAQEHAMCLGLEPEINAVLLIYSVDVQYACLSMIEDSLSLFLCQAEKCQSVLQL